MHQSLIMTVLGPDRPGIVRSLSETVARHGGNWLESRMVRLAGQFTGVVRIDGSAESIRALAAELSTPGIPGLLIQTVLEDHSESTPSHTIRIEVAGNDRPGIVRELSSAITAGGGNVEELQTSLHSAPMSGHLMFRADCRISLPEALDASRIVSAIEALGPDLTIDLKDGTAKSTE